MVKKPIIAICYDFDKTLTPTDMQGQGLLQACGYKTDEEITKFWETSNKYASDNNMDQNLSWMKNILEDAQGKVLINRDNMVNFGKAITFYPGVEEWFKRINEYGEQRGIEIQHYVISCGLKEIIEGTSIHEEFKEIYASSFCYNEKNVPIWVSQVVNYTSKTQYLFRIEKNVPNLSDESINKKYLPEDIAIPFRNIIYIGDSTTDVPCMTLVNSRGGYSIGVYDDDKKMDKVYQMLRENRIYYFAKADYNENSDIDILIKNIIDKTVYNENIIAKHYEDVSKLKIHDNKKDEEQKRIDNLINALEDSINYSSSINIVKDLINYEDKLDKQQVQRIIDIAVNNNQVGNIVENNIFYLKPFYTAILGNADDSNDNVKIISKKINK